MKQGRRKSGQRGQENNISGLVCEAMGQYDVAKLILESEGGLEKSQLVRQIDLSKSAVEASIHDLLEKDYITKAEDSRLIWNPEVPEEKLENIRPRSLSELNF